MLNWRTGGPPMKFLVEGKLYQKTEDLANLQMDFFIKKLIKIQSSLVASGRDPLRLLKNAFKNWKPKNVIPVFETRPISLKETVDLIGQLSNSTSHWIDNIDNYAIKIAAGTLYKPIQYVINLSLETATFTIKWKLGKLKPLLKNFDLDPMSPSSFRPICLLPTISKMMEKVVQGQLLRHLESTNQLHWDHHAYRETEHDLHAATHHRHLLCH